MSQNTLNELVKMIEDADLKVDLAAMKPNLISSLREVYSYLEAFHAIEEPTNKLHISFSNKIDAARDDILKIGPDKGVLLIESIRMLTAAENIVFLHRRKVTELGLSFLNLTVEGKLLTGSLVCRAFHELTAFMCYISENVEKKIATIERQIEEKKILKEMVNVSNFLERVYFGSSFSKTGHEMIHINEARKEYQKLCNVEEINYKKLCDYVHPNYGSNSLFGGGSLTELSYSDSKNMRDHHLVYLINIFSINMKNFNNYFQKVNGHFLLFSNVLDRLQVPNFKIQNLFKKSKYSFQAGQDGRSIQTAFDVTAAKTKIDEMNLIYQILEGLGANLTSQSLLKHDESWYDKFQTSDGEYFFKISFRL